MGFGHAHGLGFRCEAVRWLQQSEGKHFAGTAAKRMQEGGEPRKRRGLEKRPLSSDVIRSLCSQLGQLFGILSSVSYTAYAALSLMGYGSTSA